MPQEFPEEELMGWINGDDHNLENHENALE
jgi:hypothetical protein